MLNRKALIPLIIVSCFVSTKAQDVSLTYNQSIPTGIPNLQGGSILWEDFDKDGRIDLVVTGIVDGAPFSAIFKNQGSEVFIIHQILPSWQEAQFSWFDVNLDGNPDLLCAVKQTNGNLVNYYYQQNDDHTFTQNILGLPLLQNPSFKWGYLDDDALPDLIFSGVNINNLWQSYLFQNLGTGNFDQMNQLTFPSSTQWVEMQINNINNDQRMDIEVITNEFIVYFTKQEDGSYQNESNLRKDGEFFLPLSRTRIKESEGFSTFFERTILDTTIHARGSNYATPNEAIELTIPLDDRDDYLFKVRDSFGDGIQTEIGIILKDNQGVIIFNHNASEGGFDELSAKFCIGTSNDCYESPLSLMIQLDDYPDETSWDISSGTGEPRNEFITLTDTEIRTSPLSSVPELWYDLDQDGQPDALMQVSEDTWQWILNRDETWQTTTQFQSSITPQIVDFDSNGIPEIVTSTKRVDGSDELLFLSIQEFFTPFETSSVLGLNVILDESNYLDVTWNVTEPFSTQKLSVIKDGIEMTPLGSNEYGLLQLNDSFKLKIEESGTYSIAISSIGFNRLISNKIESDEIIVSNNITKTLFQKIAQSITKIDYPEQTFLDYDNDGDLDVHVSGRIAGANEFSNNLYLNDNGNYIKTQLEFPMVGNEAKSWIDFDNDGDLDLLMTGEELVQFKTTLHLLRNNDGKLDEVENDIQPLSFATHEWGDFDNDGDFDLLLVGGLVDEVSVVPKTAFYRNDNGFMNEIETNIKDLLAAKARWFDFNNDGFLDLIISGVDEGGLNQTILYENVDFELVETSEKFAGLIRPEIELSDYDQDGDIDIFLSGNTDNTAGECHLYENENGVFSEVATSLPDLSTGRAAWIDYDNDGDEDLLLTGSINFEDDIYLYNNNNGDLTLEENTGIDPLTFSTLDIGDVNGDAKLDVLYGGNITSGGSEIGRSHFYINSSSEINSPPAPPSSIVVNVNSLGGLDEKTISIQWESGSDNETSASGLAYRITLIRNGALLTPKYDLGDYTTRMLKHDFYSLPSGEYTCLIQSIDNGLLVSEYSDSVAFTIDEPFSRTEYETNFTDLANYGISWADYDNDGDHDALITGITSFNNGFVRHTRLFNNNGSGFDQVSTNFKNIGGDSHAWGDYDNDGDLDVVFGLDAGDQGSFLPSSVMYRNDGNEFTEVMGEFNEIGIRYAEWFDANLDGALDLLIVGEDRNFDEGVWLFTNADGSLNGEKLSITPYGDEVLIKDFDNDGDKDIWIGGDQSLITEIGSEYHENKNGSFFLAINQFNTTYTYALNSSDYDSDGDLDVIMFAAGSEKEAYSFYTNNGDSTFVKSFSDIEYMEVQVEGGGMTWGDYDNDGDYDLLLSGIDRINSEFGHKTYLYRNDNNELVNSGVELIGSHFTFVDHDKDGDLDIYAIDVNVEDYTEVDNNFIYYENKLSSGNQPPTHPNSFSSTEKDGNVMFSWDGAFDLETPSNGLSYNLKLFDGNKTIVAPSITSSNELNLLQLGNTNVISSFTYKGLLDDGVYNWSVQSIDNIYQTSQFSPDQSFTYCYNYSSTFNEISSESKNFITGTPIPFTSSVPENTTSVHWDFGDGFMSTDKNPSHIYSEPGIYQIVLTLTSDLGCELITKIEVEIGEPNSQPKITNVITPNGDNKNDFLVVTNARLDLENTLEIFNAQGQSLFKTTNYLNDWDGTKNGSPLPAGQYLAVFENPTLNVKTSVVFTILR